MAVPVTPQRAAPSIIFSFGVDTTIAEVRDIVRETRAQTVEGGGVGRQSHSYILYTLDMRKRRVTAEEIVLAPRSEFCQSSFSR